MTPHRTTSRVVVRCGSNSGMSFRTSTYKFKTSPTLIPRVASMRTVSAQASERTSESRRERIGAAPRSGTAAARDSTGTAGNFLTGAPSCRKLNFNVRKLNFDSRKLNFGDRGTLPRPPATGEASPVLLQLGLFYPLPPRFSTFLLF